MAQIDFVPTEYIQNKESGRANFMYLMLFVIFMGAIGAVFAQIKKSQRDAAAELVILNNRLESAREEIGKLEQLKAKGSQMMETAALTSELLEAVPKSVILADLTNKLPKGVSLMELKLVQKKPAASSSSSSQYKKASKAAAAKNARPVSQEKLLTTTLEIKGIAPSDIEVAGYISQLTGSVLLGNIALVHSKEYEIDEVKFREFKLKASLAKDVLLTKENVDGIRANNTQQM